MDTRSLPVTPHSVAVMLRPDGRVFIEVYSRPINGPATIDGLPAVLPRIDDAAVLGDAILQGLERSTFRTMPAPDPGNNPMVEEILTWAGARDWKSYTKGSKSVGIFARYLTAPPTTVSITPEAWNRKGGFSPIDDEYRENVPFASAEELGRLVQQAMKVARA